MRDEKQLPKLFISAECRYGVDMARRPRQAAGGIVYHVVNRGCGRMKLFGRDGDYAAFEAILAQGQARQPMRLLTYCLMPNHWHLVLWPEQDGQLATFMHWVTMTHVQRWRHARKLVGLGPLYQGRYRAFPVESDEHLFTVNRYVERNPVRADLVRQATDWHWSGLDVRSAAEPPEPLTRPTVSPWPIDVPADWVQTWLNRPQTDAELDEVRRHTRTGRPFGSSDWGRKVAAAAGYAYDARPRGRPPKVAAPA